MATVTDRHRFVPTASDRAARFRHLTTAVLLEEAESRRWFLLGMLADLERDPGSWEYAEQTVAFVLTALEDLEAELKRRKALSSRPGAPPWPHANARRYADLIAVAEELKALWPIERYCADELGMTLDRRGTRLVGTCPFPDHPDTDPSFTVGPGPTLWHCFGCGRGGDVYNLMEQLHGIDRFADQVTHLAMITSYQREAVRDGD